MQKKDGIFTDGNWQKLSLSKNKIPTAINSICVNNER